MDSMNMFNILTVSVPEYILDVILALLVIGEKQRLKFNKVNLLLFGLAVFLMANATFIIRNSFNFGALTFLLMLFSYIAILKVVYNIKIGKAILATLFFYGIIIAAESTYIIPFLSITKLSQEQIFSSDILRFMLSVPERFIQGLVVVSIWNFKETIADIKRYENNRVMANFIVILLYVVQAIFTFTPMAYFDKMSINLRICIILGSVLFAVFDVCFFKFITQHGRNIRTEEQEIIKEKHIKIHNLTLNIDNILGRE